MALVLANRVQESATANTTVSFTLAGPISGFQSFAVIGDTNTTYYAAADASGNWEVGLGTYSAPATLTRTTVYASSNSGNAVTFSGTVNVFVTYPSGKSVNLDTAGNVSSLGTVSSGTWQGATIGVAYGGTGVTASSGANSVVLRDANQNIFANSITQSISVVTSAGGTTVLTAASPHFQILIGTATQTFQLPDATLLPTGSSWIFDNDSTQNLTVVDAASGPIDTVAPGGYATVFLEANGTTAGIWGRFGMIPREVNWGTNNLDLGGLTNVTNGTWQGNAVQPAYGGTGLTTFVGANNALYSTGATTLTAGTLPSAAGGTGLTTFTGANNALYSTDASTLTAGTLPVAAGGTGATTLTGYVKGNGTGAMTASASIPNSDTTATSANTANAIVARDASGNFSAGTITADLTGTASSATSATTSTNLAGGVGGAVPYQSGVGTTGFSAAGTTGQVLTSAGTGAPTWTTATDANTASAIVQRDASGNFSAGTITASLNGNASTATSATSATSATTATNLAAGTAGAVPYQSGAGTTGFSAAGTSGQVLTSTGTGAPTWTTATNANTASAIVQRDASGNFSAGTITADLTGTASSATSATTSSNLAGGVAGAVPYQSNTGTTAFSNAGSAGQVLTSNGTSAPSWTTATNANTASAIVQRDASGNFSAGTITATLSGSATTATTATNLDGGVAGALPYQSGAGTTAFSAAGTAGQLLQSNGGSAPTWVTPSYAPLANPTFTGTVSVNGNTNLGNSATGQTYTTRISGYGVDDGGLYGSYGTMIVNATSAFTSGARRYMITNALSGNTFAIIRSTDATTDPAIGSAGNLSSGTVDFAMSNTGNVGIGTASPFANLHVNGSTGILTRRSSLQDGVAIVGRAGGTGEFEVTLTPTVLSADRTLTLPNNSGTILTTGAAVTIGQGGTGATDAATARANLGTTDAGNLTSGTVATARLASVGTASATTFLRGDQSWSQPALTGLSGLTISSPTEGQAIVYQSTTLAGGAYQFPPNGSVIWNKSSPTLDVSSPSAAVLARIQALSNGSALTIMLASNGSTRNLTATGPATGGPTTYTVPVSASSDTGLSEVIEEITFPTLVVPAAWQNASLSVSSTTEFGSTATWTKPTGAKWVLVQLWGAGGGGGKGGVSGQGSNASGGGGGGGGSYATLAFPANSLASSYTVTIGAGGTGATSSNGGNGGTTSFGTLLYAYGGGGGLGGFSSSASTGGGGASLLNSANLNGGGQPSGGTSWGLGGGGIDGVSGGGAGIQNIYGGASGGGGSAGGSASIGGQAAFGGAGGGSGGGTKGTSFAAGGGGGGRQSLSGVSGGGTDGAAGSNGTTLIMGFGLGGGGGASSTGSVAGAGGTGGRASGGGGGGASTGTGGNGGTGGAGYATITTYF